MCAGEVILERLKMLLRQPVPDMRLLVLCHRLWPSYPQFRQWAVWTDVVAGRVGASIRYAQFAPLVVEIHPRVRDGLIRSPPVSGELSPHFFLRGHELIMANKPINPELKERAIMHLLPPYNWSLRQAADGIEAGIFTVHGWLAGLLNAECVQTHIAASQQVSFEAAADLQNCSSLLLWNWKQKRQNR